MSLAAVSGGGSINGVVADGGTLKIEGALAANYFQIGPDATLELSSGTTGNVSFAGNYNGDLATLILDAPTTFMGSITTITAGEIIDLVGVTASSASYNGSTPTISETNGQQLTYNVSGSLAGDIVKVASDNNGGTDVYWVPPLEGWIISKATVQSVAR